MLTYREAAKLLGVHFTVVQRHAKRGNIKTGKYTVEVEGIPMSEVFRLRDSGFVLMKNKGKRQAKIIKDYAKGGSTMKQVAAKHGVTESYVSKLLKRHNKAE